MVASKATNEAVYYMYHENGPGLSPTFVANYIGSSVEYYNFTDRYTIAENPSDVFVVAFTYDEGNQNTIWYNGTKVSTFAQTVSNPSNNIYDHFGSPANNLDASLFEVVMYDSPLSDADMAAVMAHLKTKWNIA
jgi:hypothetical protein